MCRRPLSSCRARLRAAVAAAQSAPDGADWDAFDEVPVLGHAAQRWTHQQTSDGLWRGAIKRSLRLRALCAPYNFRAFVSR